jgi:hypothetical protein
LGLRTLLENHLQSEYKLGTVSATYITGDFEITGDKSSIDVRGMAMEYLSPVISNHR